MKTKSPPPRRRLRLLPLTITMLSLLLVVKLNEIYIGSQQLRAFYAVNDASAEEKKADAAKPADKPADAKSADAKPADTKPADASPPAAAPAGDAAPPAETPAKEGEAKPEDGKKEEGKKEGKPPEEPKTFGTGKTTLKEIEALKARDTSPRYSKSELDLLENLSKRREELDARDRELDMKAKILDASEKRINDKITEMKTLQTDLSKVLAQYNEKQDAQIKSLVKIYETMKPDEAAKIFNELEMPILLDVIGKMSERKVALVLANMDPKRAREVTQELADRRKKDAERGASATSPAAKAPVAAAPSAPAKP